MPWGPTSRQSRGYGSSWDKVRKIVIARDMGLCQPCKKIGRVTKFYAVDHIVSRALAKRLGWSEARTESPENCQCICDPCHKTKTEEEQGKKKNPPKQKIGADGWPIE